MKGSCVLASFTEQAVLSVIDKSTPQLRKINAELARLAATVVVKLKSIKVDLGIRDSGLSKAQADIRLPARQPKCSGFTPWDLARSRSGSTPHRRCSRSRSCNVRRSARSP